SLVGLICVFLTACPEQQPSADAGVRIPDAGVCPTKLRFSVLDDGKVHAGWTGATHENKLPTNAVFVLQVDHCDPSCRNCSFHGPIPDPNVKTQRCLSDTRVACSSTLLNDPACPRYRCNNFQGQGVTLCADNARACGNDGECDFGSCSFFLGGNAASPIGL